MPTPLVIQATAKHRATLIFLHGLSQTGHEWYALLAPIAERLPHLRIVIPTAPLRPLTLLCGLPAHGWFDAYGWGHDSRQDTKGVKSAAETVRALISEEIAMGVASSGVFVGGFSQGGALALYTAVTDIRQFAGVLALSTWLPLFREFPAAAKHGCTSPILQCHGLKDPTILPYLGKGSGEILKQFCPRHKLKLYKDAEHDVVEAETEDIISFLQKHSSKL